MMRSLGGVSSQVQDIAVQLQMGTRYSTVLAQQGSQLLSAFGAGGAIAGGVVAIGGAFLQMADNAKQAFTDAAKGQREFEAEAQKMIADSNGAQLFSGAVKAQERLKSLSDEFDQMWEKRSAGDVIAETFGGPSFSEKYLAAADRIAATEKIINGELSKAMLESSQRDTALVEMRTDGRAREAAWIERQIALSKELSQIDALRLERGAEDQLRAESQRRSDLAATADMEGQVKSTMQLVEYSEQDTQLSQLKGQGLRYEAEALDRQLKLRRELDRIDGLKDVPQSVKEQLKTNAGSQSDLGYAEKVAEAQQKLDEQKRKNSLDEMSLEGRIQALGEEAARTAADETRMRKSAVPDAEKILATESKRVALQHEINQLMKQYVTEQKAAGEAAKREAEAAKREAEASAKQASSRRSSVLDTAMEYNLLKAKAGGNERRIEEAERQQRVMERKQRYEDNNGMDSTAATALALKMTDLEDQANGKGSKIHGVQESGDPNMRNGLSPAWQSGPSGPGKYRGLGMGSDPLSENGGLNGFWDLQAGRVGSRSSASEAYSSLPWNTGPQMQDQHANNAAKDSAGSSGNGAVDAFIEKLISRLPPALADAILAKS
mgnify:FL=1